MIAISSSWAPTMGAMWRTASSSMLIHGFVPVVWTLVK